MRTRITTHVLVHRGQALCDNSQSAAIPTRILRLRLSEEQIYKKGRPAEVPKAYEPVRTQQTPSDANMSLTHCLVHCTQVRWVSPISYTTASQHVQHVVERSLFLGRLVGFGQQRDKLLNRAAGFEHMFYTREQT